jgi:hypothetical protein
MSSSREAINAAELCDALSSLCKVNSDGIPPTETVVYGLQGAEIRHVIDAQNIFKETKYCRVFLRYGNYRVGWVLNDSTSECMLCKEPFGIIGARHHCRACGCIACSECCSERALIKQLPGVECRVCDVCAAKHPPAVVWDLEADEKTESMRVGIADEEVVDTLS